MRCLLAVSFGFASLNRGSYRRHYEPAGQVRGAISGLGVFEKLRQGVFLSLKAINLLRKMKFRAPAKQFRRTRSLVERGKIKLTRLTKTVIGIGLLSEP